MIWLLLSQQRRTQFKPIKCRFCCWKDGQGQSRKQWRPPQNSLSFPDKLFCSRCNFSLKSSIQFGNSSNYSLFTGENTAINDSMVTVLASVGLTKKRFGHQAILMIFSSRSPRKVTVDNNSLSNLKVIYCSSN